MVSRSTKAIATLVMIFAAFIINALSNIVPPTGQTVGDISNTVFQEVLITPANYAFAIWGLIYLGVFTFGIYQVLPTNRNLPQIDALRSPMMVASAAQISWIFLFLYGQYFLSLVAMVVIWGALCWGYRYIFGSRQNWTPKQRWSVQMPWSIYFGWISVATIVNVALTLFDWNWRGGFLSPQGWTIGLMLVATAIGGIALWRHRDLAFAGVFVWALVAIAQRHREVMPLFGTGLGAALALGLLGVYCWAQPKLKRG